MDYDSTRTCDCCGMSSGYSEVCGACEANERGYNAGYNAGRRDALAWIPCSPETMPDGTRKVVFISVDGIGFGCLCEDGRWEDFSTRDSDGNPVSYYGKEVTHWMPLHKPPAPAKAEQGGEE